MPESKNWKKNWQKNVSGGRLQRTIPTVRCGSMKLQRKNMCFPESSGGNGAQPIWSSKIIRSRCTNGDLYIRMTGRFLMPSVRPWTAVMSIFPMKSDKSVMKRYLSGSVMSGFRSMIRIISHIRSWGRRLILQEKKRTRSCWSRRQRGTP